MSSRSNGVDLQNGIQLGAVDGPEIEFLKNKPQFRGSSSVITSFQK
jgi:hypothetical protein